MAQPTLIDGPTKWIKRNGRARRVQVNERGQERQHWLLRAEAVDIGELEVARLSPEQAYDLFEAIRFADKDGVPFCPHCKTERAYRLTVHRQTKEGIKPVTLYKCRNQKGDADKKPCGKRFSVTSGTIFASHKKPIGDLLCALLSFVHSVSGKAALEMRKTLHCSYKTAFVLEGKLREAILKSRDPRPLQGTVEVDGTKVGGHDRKASKKEKGREKRIGHPSPANVFVLLRERSPTGESRLEVFDHESHYRDASTDKDFIRDNVAFNTHMVSDEGFELGYIGPHDRVSHKEGFKIGGVHNNGAESFFARVKRAEEGVYYGWSGKKDYLRLYGAEVSWREDYRRRSNGDLWRMLISAVTRAPQSRLWGGYWQRWKADDPSIRRRHRMAEPSVVSIP